jgi:hypothetical protein
MTVIQPRRTFVRKQQEEHSLAVILIGMSSLFIFCQSFKIIPDLYELIVCSNNGNLGHNCTMSKIPVMNVIMRLSHFLVCFNSSTNFLIYYLNGKKFRKAWIDTYGSCWCCVDDSKIEGQQIQMSTAQGNNLPLGRHFSVANTEPPTPKGERRVRMEKCKALETNDITVIDVVELKSGNDTGGSEGQVEV